MRKHIIIFFIPMILLMAGVPLSEANSLTDAVVKIFVTSNPIDYYRPWQSKGSESATGSGFVISGDRIITNAHVVADSTFIQVRKESKPNKYTAHVVAIGYDCDLAILKVDDPAFFKGVTPLEFGNLPDLQDLVTVVGFPMGGDKLSITEGVVSRIEIEPYAESAKQLLAVQIDAAINPGNSGGPVILNNKVVGIAMQSISNTQNIGFMIPPPIVNHFLTDFKDGHYDGFPTIGIDFFNTESKTLRKSYKVGEKDGGVLITRVMPFSSSYGKLQEGDIVLEIDGTPLGVDGTFEFRKNERLLMSHLINDKQIGEDITLKIVRGGQVRTEKIKIAPYLDLVPQPRASPQPSYYIYGGLIFTVLTMDLLKEFGENERWWQNSPIDFVYYLIGSGRLNEKNKREIVILLEVLPDDINVGYHGLSNQVISKVNGKTFDSFKDFIKLLQSNKDGIMVFETDSRVRIFLDNKDINQTTTEIIKRNSIPARYSKDVGEWLKNRF